jgi:hypothetical protein
MKLLLKISHVQELFISVAFGRITAHSSEFHKKKIYIYIYVCVCVLKRTKLWLAFNHMMPLTGCVKSHQLATY